MDTNPLLFVFSNRSLDSMMRTLTLEGSAYERGLQHGKYIAENHPSLRLKISKSIEESADKTTKTGFADKLYQFSKGNCPEEYQEMAGIAAGANLNKKKLFYFLCKSIVRDVTSSPNHGEGCSAWASLTEDGYTIAVKNRDTQKPDDGRQSVFIADGKDLHYGKILSLGSLGAPGVYSSGMNQAGLVVLDTHIGTNEHSIGWLRYFLMSRILKRAESVQQALSIVRELKHVGGGSLILADKDGEMACVELDPSHTQFDDTAPFLRTNHFISDALSKKTKLFDYDKIDQNSHRRHEFLKKILSKKPNSIDRVKEVMATHIDSTGHDIPVCQHNKRGHAETISCAIYKTNDLTLHISSGQPCRKKWFKFKL